MNQGNAKKVKTVRFDDMELERIRSAATRHPLSEAEVIRKVVRIGLVDLLDGEDEDALLRQRKADKSPDVDGQSFLNSLKAEFTNRKWAIAARSKPSRLPPTAATKYLR